MKNLQFSILAFTLYILICFIPVTANKAQINVFDKNYITKIMYKVNEYQVAVNGKTVNRNWKQATYYTGVMAFYKITHDKKLMEQAISWAEKNEWEIGNEIFFPANRLTCTQTYLQLFFEKHDSSMIINTLVNLDDELAITEPAYLRGWYYVDALFVGIPPFMMMTAATGENKYADYGNRIFWEIADQLFDKSEGLFYRDNEARNYDNSVNGKKVLWSRGNGWAIASLPRILEYLPVKNSHYKRFTNLLQQMATSLSQRQGEDGFWRSNLADFDEYPMPESSGTAFFTYALAWGLNNGILQRETFEPIVRKAWTGLCSVVNEEGKVCWGQLEARKPGKVEKEDSDEFITGAFLLAGSEMLKLIENRE